ncbi:MAG TPA: hypothetical protein PKA90_14265, partial [Ignavibacteria bacterium]|nr:hypothetical protein [Ignavibacteria bacterium]HMR41584.1 hypothetical protein [Ignavibacteria bacterium]
SKISGYKDIVNCRDGIYLFRLFNPVGTNTGWHTKSRYDPILSRYSYNSALSMSNIGKNAIKLLNCFPLIIRLF